MKTYLGNICDYCNQRKNKKKTASESIGSYIYVNLSHSEISSRSSQEQDRLFVLQNSTTTQAATTTGRKNLSLSFKT